MGAGLPGRKIEDGSSGCPQLSLETSAWGQVPEQVLVHILRVGSFIVPSRADVHLARYVVIHSASRRVPDWHLHAWRRCKSDRQAVATADMAQQRSFPAGLQPKNGWEGSQRLGQNLRGQ